MSDHSGQVNEGRRATGKCSRGSWLLILIAFWPCSLKGQSSSTQLWGEYMLNYSFANSFNLENAFVYSTILESPRWQSLEYAPTLEYSLDANFDFSFGLTLSYTNQTEDYNTFEVRPVLGSRIHLTPNKRILTRVYVRMENRNIKNLETDEWESTWRPRIRSEFLIPINKKSYYEDQLWYAIADAEWFFATDDDLDERFANRFRVRLGIGYRLDYGSRLEFIYMHQESKNGITDDVYTRDSIFRFRYKHFLRKHKPTKMSGTGN
ncbi:MAG TPA: DUF2490 domain-containing protein [Chryseolinea sp.]